MKKYFVIFLCILQIFYCIQKGKIQKINNKNLLKAKPSEKSIIQFKNKKIFVKKTSSSDNSSTNNSADKNTKTDEPIGEIKAIKLHVLRTKINSDQSNGWYPFNGCDLNIM